MIALFREQAKEVYSEDAINHWISKMDIPEYIKKTLERELRVIGLHCANFEDQCEFDVQGNKDWVLAVLQEFL